MNFIKESADKNPIVDTVFAIVRKANAAKETFGAENVIDATLGSLYSEDGNLVAMDSVFKSFDEVTPKQKAGYAAGFLGNADFRTLCTQWTVGGTNLASSVVATPGGTGAVSLGIGEFLETGETVVIPDIAWTSYAIMAQDKQLKAVKYSMFDENDNFNLADIKEKVNSLKGKQNRIVIVVNDPCHNPTGYTMSDAEWKEFISFLNEVGKTTPCIILNDIAYIDYSYNLAHSRDYMKNFEAMSENVMVVVAMSCSKTLTSYGMRCGAAVIAAKSAESVKLAEVVFEKSARALWSNVNNGAMHNFCNVMRNHYDEFMAEKAGYIKLLKERSDIFKAEAAQCGLALYPYSEGFFITVKVDNAIREIYHEALMENNIFTVQVDKGIRVAVCSLPVNKAKGLAAKMKNILDEIKA
ncbi:MAG: aminotransferase class I/II-fold pyridoxal phosphate-dependent enzyme [Oscillospiraceae bacterium]|nr:aminotransferase class I/II-fold pyridoxal phosphate-dependent enzyme [Oscillospiraceae bacterium]